MNLQAAADALQAARHVCILTGAGASAESGVPTFREALTGLWEQYDPLELATPEAFQRDPDLVWKWYCWRRELVSKVSPNAGHYALAALAQKVRTLTLITQNVDGLHQRAGSDSVIEYHGNLFENRCFAGNCDVSDADLSVASPTCPHCGDRIRPGVVWFGEAIPDHAKDAASLAAGDCDVFLSIGTSSMVWPAAGLAEIAQANGATVVEINPDASASPRPDHYAIAGESGVILPKLLAMLGE
jgi:NAD-dependent deacetylase